MNIISKFKDYYDIGLSFGIDKSIIYKREEKEYLIGILRSRYTMGEVSATVFSRDDEEKIINLFNNWKTFGSNSSKISCSNFILGFCGEIYFGVTFEFRKKGPDSLISEETKKEVVYDINHIKSLFEKYPEHFSEKEKREFFTNKKMLSVWWKTFSKFNFEQFHSNNQDLTFLENIFYKFSCPIYVIRMNENNLVVQTNPNLANLQFYKISDAYSTFQKIQQFKSGVLGSNENNMVELSNKEKLKKRGFDHKYAFRKEPKEKK